MSKYVRVNYDNEKRCDVYETDERMNNVYKLFVLMELDKIIGYVIDRKGELMIYWENEPSENQKKCAEHIWNMLGETYISHYSYNTNF